MHSNKLAAMSLEQAHKKLRFYTALDRSLRLRAFSLIAEKPGVSLNEIRRTLKVDKGLLAFHLGILKVGGLISFDERKRRQISTYNLTDAGKQMQRELAKHR